MKQHTPPGAAFQQNAVLLLSCFALAVLLWMYVAGLDPANVEAHSEVSAALQVTQALMPIHEPELTTIAVSLQGPPASLAHPLVHARLDLGSVHTPGIHNVPVIVQTPDPLLTAVAVPDHVPVFLDTKETRTLPVVFQQLKQPPPGFTSGTPVIRPEVVTVIGPSTLLSKAKAQVDFDVTNMTAGVDVSLPVHISSAPARYAHLFSIQPAQVQVYVPIHRETAYATVPIEIRFSGEPQAGYVRSRAEAHPSEVTVSGMPAVLGQLTTIPTMPVDIEGLSQATTIRTRLDPPEGVQVEGVHVVRVHVSVRRLPEPSVAATGNVSPGGFNDTVIPRPLPTAPSSSTTPQQQGLSGGPMRR